MSCDIAKALLILKHLPRLHVHRCGPGNSMRACDAAGPGSIPGRDKLPGWGFYRGFSPTVRQMSGSFRPPRSPNIICPSLSSSIIIHCGRQWPEMLTRPKASNIHTYRHFTYVTTHSPTLPSFYLRHNSFPNPSVDSPTSQFIFQPFFRFSYATSSSLNSPGESPMWLAELILQPFRHFTYVTIHSPTIPSLYLRHSSFPNPSFASPTSQALHLIHTGEPPMICIVTLTCSDPLFSEVEKMRPVELSCSKEICPIVNILMK